MHDLLIALQAFWEEYGVLLLEGIRDTLYMTLLSTFFGYIIGLPMGIVLTLTDKEGISPNRIIYTILDVIINITRSIPFLILLILLVPITKALVGKSYGSTATIVPLTVAAAPLRFSSLKSVSRPLENKINTTPICEKLSARTFSVTDFPVPVAPQINPCLLALSGLMHILSPSVSPSPFLAK